MSIASQSLLGKDTGIMRLHGKRLAYTNDDTKIDAIPLLPPPHLLRRPQDKRMAWADMLALDAWADELGLKRGDCL